MLDLSPLGLASNVLDWEHRDVGIPVSPQKNLSQSLPRHFTGNSNSMGSSSIFLFWVALKRNVRPIFNSKSFALSIVYALLTILLSSSQKHHGHYIPIGRTSQLHCNAVQQHGIIKRQGSQKAAIFSLEVQSLDVI